MMCLLQDEVLAQKEKEKIGDMDAGGKNLNRRQINSLLKRYPQKIDEDVYGKRRN